MRRLTALVTLALACAPTDPATTESGSTGSSTDASSSTTGATEATTGTTDEPTTGGTSTTADATTSTTTSTTDGVTSTTSTTTEGDTTTSTTSTTSTTDASSSTDTSTTSTTDASTTDSTGTTGDTEGLGDAALAAMAALEEVVDGVLWPSESDYPWLVFGLADAAPVTVDNLKLLVGDLVVIENGEPPLDEQAIEEEPWQKRFDQMTAPQDWWTDYEFMRAAQYEAIRDVLGLHLVNLKSFRIGEDGGGYLSGAIDMFVIGETADGDLVGIQTISIET